LTRTLLPLPTERETIWSIDKWNKQRQTYPGSP
jgi:hypothetical protein